MIAITLNAAFSAALVFFAMNSVVKGWLFFRHGWQTVQTQTRCPDYRFNVERRRLIGEGRRFLVSGLLWLVASGGALIAGLHFGWLAFSMLYLQG